MSFKNKIPRFLIAVMAATLAPNVRSQNLERLANAADAIVVGKPSNPAATPNGVRFSLSIVRVVHGSPLPGEKLNAFVSLKADSRNPDPAAEVRSAGCGLYMLKSTPQGWQLPTPQVPLFSKAVFPLGTCDATAVVYPQGASAFEKSFIELAAAGGQATRLFDYAGSSGSSIVADVMKKGSSSSQLGIKADATAWLASRGDVRALIELEKLAEGPLARPPSSFNQALSRYVNPDPSGVRALGRLALGEKIVDSGLRVQASRALWSIHTKEAVPYLAGLLSSTDALLRQSAVSGLTEYVKNVRIAPDGPERNEALDEAFNPGRKPAGAPSVVEQNFLHLGPFNSPEEDTRFVALWKRWWVVRQVDFPPAQMTN